MGLFRKFFQNKKDKLQEASLPKKTFGDKIHDKINILTKFFDGFLEDFKIFKEKLSNLNQTNYQLGLKLLERGNVHEATRRFAITKLFWPKCYDAYYQYSYCLVLTKRPFKAKKILRDLLDKKPDYDKKALELLNNIEHNEV